MPEGLDLVSHGPSHRLRGLPSTHEEFAELQSPVLKERKINHRGLRLVQIEKPGIVRHARQLQDPDIRA